MSTAEFSITLRNFYADECGRIHNAFEVSGDGVAAARQRAKLVDHILRESWYQLFRSSSKGFAAVAIGGFGRKTLLPHSDVDLLFLAETEAVEKEYRDHIREISRDMWDIQMRISSTTRTLAECDRVDQNNVEFTISLLDSRFLIGDQEVYNRLRRKILPQLINREWQTLVQSLSAMTRERHAKYGNTIFHLEPNVKDSPGGLRDYNVACWLALLGKFDPHHPLLPDPEEPNEADLKDLDAARDFLLGVRCFLHYRHGRDDNSLTWESQDDVAASEAYALKGNNDQAAGWMRHYFRNARAIHHSMTQLLHEVPPKRSSLYRQFQSWRSRLSNADFSVTDGLIFFKQSSAAHDPETLLRTFEFVAHHGLRLAADTERHISEALPTVAAQLLSQTLLWPHLSQILIMPHAADALRSMHMLGVLKLILPEYELVDALVIRDPYHRYTVDEHSFLTIEHLHRLKRMPTDWEQRFADLLGELENPGLLYLALLLHDLGKATSLDQHVDASVKLAGPILERLGLSAQDRETVLFLIGSHLEMSSTLRRDIFHHETIEAFAEKTGTPERLKMLCLLTYADIRSVNPEAMTPWKADNLWRLYVRTSNHINRHVDENRVGGAFEERIAAISARIPECADQLFDFLAGLPQRYMKLHSTEDLLRHFRMSQQLAQQPVQLALSPVRDLYDLTMVTRDRPSLFATVAGVLFAWGMDIVKANAFGNDTGVVVDNLLFRDRFRTLELNPPERVRFKRCIAQVLSGEMTLDQVIQNRKRASKKAGTIKGTIETRLKLDNDSSPRSTLLEVIAQDRPGLLYTIASMLVKHNCNIEIALIDTEGQTTIDVFYITSNGAKLVEEQCAFLQHSLLKALQHES